MHDGSPGAGRTTSRLGTGVSVAFLRRVYTVAGRVYVEVVDPDGGARPYSVPVAVLGGGDAAFAFFPPPQPALESDPFGPGAVQVLLLHRQNARPVCLGAIAHRRTDIRDDAPEVDPTADHPGTVGKQDFALVRGGARLIIDERGAVTIDAKGATDPTVRVQLPASGVLRVARDGAATERVPLAGPLLDYLQEVDAYLRKVDAWAKGLVVATSTGPDVVKGSGAPLSPLSASPPPLTPDAIRAAALHVSADDEVTP